MKRFRESLLGRFVTRQQAEADPAGTVAETVSDAPQVEASLRWRIADLESAMLQAAAKLRTEQPEPRAVAHVLEQVARAQP